jgi:hypothetical protein
MPITVKHLKVSTVPDAGDDTLVEPSDWNADHTITGTVPVENGGTGASTLTGYVKGTGTTPMTASSTIPNTDITGLGTASTKDAGAALGVATLDAGGKVPVSELPAAVLGALSYQGTWDASTNTPTLTSSVGTKGYYYVVSVAGNTNLNGITDWLVGDWAVYNGSIWQKVDNTETVTSVNGQVGAVVLTQADISGTVPTSRTLTAGTGLTGGGDLSADRTFAIDSTVATLTGTQTLTNKTLTSPKVNEILDANGNEVLGLLSTASATDYLAIKNGIGVGVPLHISSEGSSANIGLHIQPKGTGLVTISDGTDFNKGIRFRSSGSAASAITLLDAVSSAGHVVTLPDATTTLVGRNTTDTLTNKSISGSTNTLSNIGNSSLTNSAITINGTSTSLGGSINVGTVTSVDLTASTGISVSGGPITGSGSITVTNTAPDQTVVLTAGTGISTSGTYPNFTITNTAPSSGGTVTSVTGTAPVVSSGGNTPAISMAAATGSVNGYLTSTDWTTFNSKGAGTVTSITAGTGLTGGTITGSGTIAIDSTVATLTGTQSLQNKTLDITNTVTLSDALFTLQDDADTTKQAVFQLSGITTATTRTYTLPNLTGSLATIGNLAQTFAGNTTFSNATLSLGTSTAAGTYTLGNGATISGATRTINIGTAGVAGSTTAVNIGGTANTSTTTVNGVFITPVPQASNGIIVNSKTISASYTIAATDNAMSAGPVTIASGQTVTVSSGSRWVVL